MNDQDGRSAIALVLLHFLGSSRHEWDAVIALLDERPVLALDLPGFGDEASAGALDVERMAAFVDRAIRAAGHERVVIVGHSMSGKVAAALATTRPDYLHGLVMIAASPPAPEPMSEADRIRLLAFDGREQAGAEYLDGITAKPLLDEARAIGVRDASRCSLEAWRAWIETGSQEDWSDRVGIRHEPMRVVVGRDDPSLGEQVQRTLTMPHWPAADLVVIEGGHALPLENPAEVARALREFVQTT